MSQKRVMKGRRQTSDNGTPDLGQRESLVSGRIISVSITFLLPKICRTGQAWCGDMAQACRRAVTGRDKTRTRDLESRENKGLEKMRIRKDVVVAKTSLMDA